MKKELTKFVIDIYCSFSYSDVSLIISKIPLGNRVAYLLRTSFLFKGIRRYLYSKEWFNNYKRHLLCHHYELNVEITAPFQNLLQLFKNEKILNVGRNIYFHLKPAAILITA